MKKSLTPLQVGVNFTDFCRPSLWEGAARQLGLAPHVNGVRHKG
jgi:hypothetical protein